MINKIRKSYYPLIFSLALVSLALPATLYLVLRSQETRSKAATNCIVPYGKYYDLNDSRHKPCCSGLVAIYRGGEKKCLPSGEISITGSKEITPALTSTFCRGSCSRCDLNGNGKITDDELIAVHGKVDANCDGILSGADLSFCITCRTCVRSCSNCDINGDGRISEEEIIGVHLRADANCDGILSGADLSFCVSCANSSGITTAPVPMETAPTIDPKWCVTKGGVWRSDKPCCQGLGKKWSSGMYKCL